MLGIASFACTFVIVQLGYHALSDVPFSNEYVGLSIVGGVLAALLLSILFRALQLEPVKGLVAVWFSLFVIQMFADLIEGAFFTTKVSTITSFLGGTLAALVTTFLESLTGLLLFPSVSSPLSLSRLLSAYFRARPGQLRLLAGSVSYFPVYFFFGALVSPFVIPYYTDQSLGLGLTIPSFYILVPIELLRGLLFVLALVPIIAAVKFSTKSTFIFLALFLYVIGAFVPFVAGTTLPWILKLYHSLEILADSIVYAAILAFLFKRGQ